jgi:DNA processing protein
VRFFSTKVIDTSALGIKKASYLELGGVLAPAPRIAIIGSRAAFISELWMVDLVLAEAQKRGISLVSGGALGVDAYAHRRALEMRLPQLIIAACAPDSIYPPDHEDLFYAVSEHDACGVLFGLRRGSNLCRGIFASRNRLIIEASTGVVVAQARVNSGSHRTGLLALKLGIPVLAGISGAGGKDLARRGASPWTAASRDAALMQVDSFLSRCLTGECTAPLGQSIARSWPRDIDWLLAYFLANEARICGLEDFPEPVLAIAAITRAIELGLAYEVNPYRYKLVQNN